MSEKGSLSDSCPAELQLEEQRGSEWQWESHRNLDCWASLILLGWYARPYQT